MNLHEYQAKALLQKYSVPTPQGMVAYSAEAAYRAANTIQGNAWVVKAQIHAGGRGKAGGVKLVKSAAEVEATAKSLLGKPLITYQNAPDGQQVNQVLVKKSCRLRANCIYRCW